MVAQNYILSSLESLVLLDSVVLLHGGLSSGLTTENELEEEAGSDSMSAAAS